MVNVFKFTHNKYEWRFPNRKGNCQAYTEEKNKKKRKKNTKLSGNAGQAHVVGIRGEKLMSLPHTPTGWVHSRTKKTGGEKKSKINT